MTFWRVGILLISGAAQAVGLMLVWTGVFQAGLILARVNLVPDTDWTLFVASCAQVLLLPLIGLVAWASLRFARALRPIAAAALSVAIIAVVVLLVSGGSVLLAYASRADYETAQALRWTGTVVAAVISALAHLSVGTAARRRTATARLGV